MPGPLREHILLGGRAHAVSPTIRKVAPPCIRKIVLIFTDYLQYSVAYTGLSNAKIYARDDTYYDWEPHLLSE